jgi:hypothetical protein
MLSEDLHRNKQASTNIQRNAHIDIDGFGQAVVPIYVQDGNTDLVIAISNPLTPRTTSDEALIHLKEYVLTPKLKLVDEMLIRKNLPEATSGILSLINSGSE